MLIVSSGQGAQRKFLCFVGAMKRPASKKPAAASPSRKKPATSNRTGLLPLGGWYDFQRQGESWVVSKKNKAPKTFNSNLKFGNKNFAGHPFFQKNIFHSPAHPFGTPLVGFCNLSCLSAAFLDEKKCPKHCELLILWNGDVYAGLDLALPNSRVTLTLW